MVTNPRPKRLKAGRTPNAVIWRCITIPEDVAACLARFLSTSEFSESYATPEEERAWERLKASVAAMPDHLKEQLPAIDWPACVPASVVERARDLAELYKSRTTAERAPLLSALGIVPLDDLHLFGITHQEARTGELRPPPPVVAAQEEPAKRGSAAKARIRGTARAS